MQRVITPRPLRKEIVASTAIHRVGLERRRARGLAPSLLGALDSTGPARPPPGGGRARSRRSPPFKTRGLLDSYATIEWRAPPSRRLGPVPAHWRAGAGRRAAVLHRRRQTATGPTLAQPSTTRPRRCCGRDTRPLGTGVPSDRRQARGPHPDRPVVLFSGGRGASASTSRSVTRIAGAGRRCPCGGGRELRTGLGHWRVHMLGDHGHHRRGSWLSEVPLRPRGEAALGVCTAELVEKPDEIGPVLLQRALDSGVRAGGGAGGSNDGPRTISPPGLWPDFGGMYSAA